MSIPRPVVRDEAIPYAVPLLTFVGFAWEPILPTSGDVVYYLRVSCDPEFTCLHVDRVIPASRCEEPNLHIGTRYFWKVVARGTNGSIAESPIWSFQTPDCPPRWIHVPGITNVRDMGGWHLPDGRPIRQGRIYRSSEMNSHVDITEEGKGALPMADLPLARS